VEGSSGAQPPWTRIGAAVGGAVPPPLFTAMRSASVSSCFGL
jgi:hypothetical protein